MVWMGLVRPIAGYLLLAPCGPVWSKLSASEMTLPFFTRRAAATMSSGWVKLRVPISSFGPHLPQFLYFSAAARRSWRFSLRVMAASRNGEPLSVLLGLLLFPHHFDERTQRSRVGPPAQPLHRALHGWRDDGVVAPLLARGDVGHVHL